MGAQQNKTLSHPPIARATLFAAFLKIGLLGFGMGGRIAFLAACRNPGDVRACVCFAPKGIENPADVNANLVDSRHED